MPPLQDLSRRKLVVGAAALSVSGIARPTTALAKVAPRHAVGKFHVQVMSDGALDIPVGMLDRAQTDADLARRVGLTAGSRLSFALNIALVKTPTDLVLIDAGAGGTWQASAGKLADNLAAAGVKAEAVTKVVITHAHPDHIWGLVDDLDDSLRFPNAEYIIPAAERDFWRTVDLASLPEATQSIGAGARRVLKAIEARTRTLAPGAEAVTGISLIDSAGHTPGHCSVIIAEGREQLLVTSDGVHHAITSFEHPDWQPRADMDAARAAVSRRRLLDMAATDKLAVLAYHLPYPGLGRVERKDGAFRWVVD
jgi:glyoxylase-like metal-dependent hydrolase (beta-lactamase superfamily II)